MLEYIIYLILYIIIYFLNIFFPSDKNIKIIHEKSIIKFNINGAIF